MFNPKYHAIALVIVAVLTFIYYIYLLSKVETMKQLLPQKAREIESQLYAGFIPGVIRMFAVLEVIVWVIYFIVR